MQESFSELKVYIESFLYLMIHNVIIVVVIVVLHEAGHFLIGSLLGCSGSIVLYSPPEPGPYTTLLCEGIIPDQTILVLSSLMLTVPFSMVFLLLKGLAERYLTLVAIGIAIWSMSTDVAMAWGSTVSYLFVGIGFAIFIIGQLVVVNDIFNRIMPNIRKMHKGESD